MRSTKRRNHWRQRRLTMESLEHRWVLSSGYGEAFAVFTDETLQVPGLVGSYVNQSLRAVDELDWRATQAIAGTRVDPALFFPTPSLGARSELGISGGSDDDWDNFSVQWDGVVQIREPDTRLATRSDDGSRMWIDVNGNGAFDDPAERFDNGWGSRQGASVGTSSAPLEPGIYRLRIQYEDGDGPNAFSLLANPLQPRGDFAVYTDATMTMQGLVGSYVNFSLRDVDEPDWRATQPISGVRVDAEIRFHEEGWGSRAEVGLTKGWDGNWEDYSVQWDGAIQIQQPGTRVATRSDDGSRMWIDIDRDGTFDNAWPELIDNHWGRGQVATTGLPSVPLEAGVYPIRIQYEGGSGANRMELVLGTAPLVRFAYVVPSNREPQPGAAAAIQDFAVRVQTWYADQLDRFGFGPKAFDYEAGADHVTPLVHTVHVGAPDTYFTPDEPPYPDLWERTVPAIQAAGLALGSSDVIWVVFLEAHLQKPGGSISGGGVLGAGGSENGGFTIVGSDTLHLLTGQQLQNDADYVGQIAPELGPYPLASGTSFPWATGTTFSSAASSAQGLVAKQLGWLFGLAADYRNETGSHGNLMGNGVYGFRGALYPDRYPTEDARLSWADALRLNVHPFFNAEQSRSSDSVPLVTVDGVGDVTPDGGQLRVHFSAADGDGLAVALLWRFGQTIGEVPLSGTQAEADFLTPYYEPESEGHYSIHVYDVQGNRRVVWFPLRVQQGFNRAPRPSILAYPSHSAGQPVVLDASLSTDPEDPAAALLVEWDLDGDGVFDTPPTTEKRYSFVPDQPGTRTVTARITDPDGAQAVASPLALRIDSVLGDVPVIRLSKDQGYGRIVQGGVPLEAGTTYVFSCRVRGAFRAGRHDHLAELVNMDGQEPIYSEVQYEALDGWTIFRRAITPAATGDYRLELAFWDTAVFEATDFSLRESSGDANLLSNGDLSQGLQDWESDGGQIELVHVPAKANWMPSAAQLVPYRRFDGQIEMLRAYQGREVMLLVPDNGVFAADPQVVNKILHRLDESWDYYRRTTGRQPQTYGNRVNWGGQTHLIGLPTLAVVEQTCGAGCGFVGVTGIEIARDFWEQTYNNAVAGEETRGLFEYEMGRNFWFFGHLFESAEVPTYHLGTAFATIYGYRAGVAAGSTEQPGNELVDWVQTYRAGFAGYLAAPDWRLIRDGGITGERIHGGLWLYLARQFGEDWHGRFFRHAWQLEAARSMDDAISNYILAASVAARRNLYAFFTGALDFPEVDGLEARVDQVLADLMDLAAATDDRFTVFNDGHSVTLSVLDNDSLGPGAMLPLAIVAVDSGHHGGTLQVDLGGRRLVYTPLAGIYSVQTFSYTVGDAYSDVGEASVTVEVVKRWHNPVHGGDVNADGQVSPADVLELINVLNDDLPAWLPRMPWGPIALLPYLDVTNDGKADALDALILINFLNGIPGGSLAVADDRYEPNDARMQAHDWGTLERTTAVDGLVLRDSADWYQFTLPRAGTWRAVVAIDFRHSAGDLDLFLHDSAGRPLGRSQSITDGESIPLAGLDAGTYFVGVLGEGLTANDYGLMISLRA
jgi:hypothetical protein